MKGYSKPLLVDVDEEVPSKPPAPRKMRKRKLNNTLFRLRDPETGLFWSSAATRPQFNRHGRKWGSEKAARRNWADYNLEMEKQRDGRPELELVQFRIEIVEEN